LSVLALTLALVPQTTAPDLHWPTWRGPTRNGLAAPDADPPLEWSEEKNVRWKVPIDGLGCSTPLVLGDRLYITTAIDLVEAGDREPVGPQPGPPSAENRQRYIVMALDRADGREVWRTVVHEAVPHDGQHETGSHASPSLVTDGERLVASFGSRGLFGLTLDGEVLWAKQLGETDIFNDFGEGSTPALHGGSVFVQWDEQGPSFVAAFDVKTGDEVWSRPREAADSSWGSPTVAVVDGKAQVILNGSDTTVAYDAETGSTVWTCGGFSKNPTTSPIVHEGVLYVMNSYLGNITQAIRLGGAKGELKETDALLWTRNRGASYVPTPVAHDGLLYFLRDSVGVLECCDATSGETVYSGKRLADLKRIHASLTVAGDRLHVVSREAGTMVIRTGAEFEILAHNHLADVFDASPVFVGDELYLRGRSHLYCIAEEK
jgi:outer membrane protein assembly factor BamB